MLENIFSKSHITMVQNKTENMKLKNNPSSFSARSS